MTTSAELRAVFVTALTGTTDAGAAVYSPFDWPTAPTSYPLILVHARRERKVSLGRNAPLFTVTASIEVIARTKSAALTGDAGSALALAAAETLKAQIETNLINNPAVWANADGTQRVQQFATVDSELNTSSSGEMPMAELLMTFDVEFIQGPDDFYPLTGTPLEGIDVTVQEPAGTVEPFFSIELPQT